MPLAATVTLTILVPLGGYAWLRCRQPKPSGEVIYGDVVELPKEARWVDARLRAGGLPSELIDAHRNAEHAIARHDRPYNP